MKGRTGENRSNVEDRIEAEISTLLKKALQKK